MVSTSSTAPERERVAIGAVCCDPVDYDEALANIRAYVDSGRPHLVLTPNITQVRQASRMPVVAEAYRSASLSTPDGWPVAAALRVLGARRDQGRVTGSDLTPMLCMLPYRIGLVGGRDDSAPRAAERLLERNPDLDIGLVERAEPGELSDPVRRAALIGRISAARLDLIFLGVGVPKQERMALELLQQLDHGVVLCVGATIDFIAGAVPRSPRWMQRLGIEWLYRLGLEPKRMFMRYFSALPYFVWQVVRAVGRSRKRLRLAQH